MQPETATLPTAMTPTSANNPASRSAFRRPQTWLLLFAFWTALPFTLATLLDLAWGHPLKFYRLSLFQLLQWWVWVPLTPLVLTLGRRFPLRSPKVPAEGGKWGTVQHFVIHLAASWMVAVGLTVYLAAISALLPVEWSPEAILKHALYAYHGFGALNQIVYWAVLGASLALTAARGSRRRA